MLPAGLWSRMARHHGETRPQHGHLPDELHSLGDEAQLFGAVTGEQSTSGRFFGSLRLSPTGGISEVGGLFQPMRYLSAAVFMVLLLANINNLLVTDMKALYAQESAVESELLLHEVYLHRVFGATPEFLIAVFELGSLLWYLLVIALNAFVATYPNATLECQVYHRWDAIARLFRGVLPTLQAFSAMRTLQYVTPGVLTPKVQDFVKQLQRGKHRPWKKLMLISGFFGLHLLYVFFGAEAFLVKFRIAGHYLSLAAQSPRSLVPILLFLNQMLGVVQLNVYTNERLFRFIFGGVDSYIDDSERRRMRVWNAAFEKAVWDRYKSPSKFLAVSLTFSDVDFQRMVLDEDKA